MLDLLLAALVEQGLVAAGGRQRTDSTHVISAVRDLNRFELAGRACGPVCRPWRSWRRVGCLR